MNASLQNGFLAAVTTVLIAATPFHATAQNEPEASSDDAAEVASGKVGGLPPCAELPTGGLTEEELKELVPDGSPGKVRIRWKTESQDENYGFNIMRADKEGGPYKKVNTSIIPGEGSTNIPKEYCFEDTTVERGKVYYYHIEAISTAGVKEIVEGTEGTRVKVKTVEEERAWLKAKASGEPASPRATTTDTTGTVTAFDAPTTSTSTEQKAN